MPEGSGVTMVARFVTPERDLCCPVRSPPERGLGLDVEFLQPHPGDTMFLNLMIKHHEGAVTMSGKQFENGAGDRITEPPQEVGVTQTKEIATMRQVLKEL